MKISRDWLGDYVDLTDLSDEEIARRLTEIGHAVEATETHAGDTVFVIEFTTNRIDAMSHFGLARELAAAFGRELLTSTYDAVPLAGATDETIPITIEAADKCSRYTALIIRGVKVGPSDARTQLRLEAVGLRPINNVVDATNYVMLAVGHPLHAFDLDRVQGPAIRVIAGRAGQAMKSLDGELRKIDTDTVLIADAKAPVGFGGIIGGENSEIVESTRNVLLECAHFDPGTIRRTARRLGIRTDASYRFERGADPNDTVATAQRCASMIIKSAGGTPSKPIDVVARPIASPTIALRAERLSVASAQVIGIGYALELFRRLGMHATPTPDGVVVTIPTYRVDLFEEADLVEEALRFYGYDRIPAQLPRVTTGDTRHDPVRDAEGTVRELLVGCGLTEVVTYSFIHPQWNALFTDEAPLTITNALTENLSTMRLSMIPGLLESVAFNRSYGTRDGAIFEVGRTYHSASAGVRESSATGIALFGSAQPHWGDAKRPYDFYDLKGVIEAIFAHYHVQAEFAPADVSWMKTGQASVARRGDVVLATAGFVAREVVQRFDIKGDVLAAQIDLESLLRATGEWQMTVVSRYPGVPMVLSLSHGRELRYGSLISKIRSMNVPFLEQVGIRDRYLADEKSDEVKTTLGMWYQSPDRSLTQEEVAEIHGRLAAQVAEALPVKIVASSA